MMNLKEAIDQSVRQNEIVTAEFAGDEASLVAELSAEYDGEVDSTRENDGTIDVWGYREDAPTGQMEWRLRVTLTD